MEPPAAGGNAQKTVEMSDVNKNMEIKEFEIKDALGDYDKHENRDRLSVKELSPCVVSWRYNGELYQIKNEYGVNAVLLKDNSLMAVIENLFGKAEDNKAYIVNGENRMMWDVSSIFKSCYADLKRKGYAVFSDLYLIDGTLYFIVTIGADDYRVSFDADNGDISKPIESR